MAKRFAVLKSGQPETAFETTLQLGIEPKGMIVLLVSVPLVILISLVAVVPGSITVHNYYNPIKSKLKNDRPDDNPQYFEDWLIRKVPPSLLSVAAYQYGTVSCTTMPLAEKTEASILQVMLGPCAWFEMDFFARNLNLREMRLVPKEVPLSLLTRATDPSKPIRDNAFKEFDGLNLQNRDLRFANLYGAVLPKADLRHVRLQGAVLLKAKLQGVIGWDKTQLQGAILGGTQLQGAGLIEADLRDADLRGADLQGADLGWTTLHSADLRGADLQGANIQGAKLQGARLDYANLQGTDLGKAELQGAVLSETEIDGVDWFQANLDGIFIHKSSIRVWDEHERFHLQETLKTIGDPEKFKAFKSRLNTAKPTIPLEILSSRLGCYSNNATILKCDSIHHESLDSYRHQVLFPKLIELACSDVAIAVGIARQGFDATKNNDPGFGLIDELAKVLTSAKPCAGLSALPEQTQEKILKTLGHGK